MAIIITFLFLAAIELTRLNLIRHTAANAAYEGARQAIVAGGTENDARQAALKLLNGIGIGNGATADVEEQFNRVTVTVSVPVRQNSWGVLRFISGGVVRQSCTLRREISLSSP